MILNLIRHSITRYNEDMLCSGALVDSPLSEKGIQLIKDLIAKDIYPRDPGVLYCSELIRTRQTLDLIYPDREKISSPYLKEIVFGEIEYCDTKEKLAEYRKAHPAGPGQGLWQDYDYKMIGGESTNEFVARVARDFPKLYAEFEEKGYDKVTIGGHGGYFRALSLIYDIPDRHYEGQGYFFNNGMGRTYEVHREGDTLKFEPLGFIGGDKLEDIIAFHFMVKK